MHEALSQMLEMNTALLLGNLEFFWKGPAHKNPSTSRSGLVNESHGAEGVPTPWEEGQGSFLVVDSNLTLENRHFPRQSTWVRVSQVK